MPVSATEIWLRRLAPTIRPWARLICFPHAGGTAAFFRPWRDYLLPDVELYAVQYPGRLDRITDACVDEMNPMAESVTRALQPLLDRPVALFGHSLGAAIAYEVARRISARSPRALTRLFVSGRTAPDRQRPSAKHLADDDALWDDIERLGGTSPEVLADPEMRRTFLPALRSDYRLSELYRPGPGPLLECPVTALLGEQDSEVEPAEAASWAGVTRADFSIHTFPGGHFYLISRLPEVIGEIMRRLAGAVPPGYREWAGP
jgi:pyochelin biosynthetic protein PchC